MYVQVSRFHVCQPRNESTKNHQVSWPENLAERVAILQQELLVRDNSCLRRDTVLICSPFQAPIVVEKQDKVGLASAFENDTSCFLKDWSATAALPTNDIAS